MRLKPHGREIFTPQVMFLAYPTIKLHFKFCMLFGHLADYLPLLNPVCFLVHMLLLQVKGIIVKIREIIVKNCR